jgi:hypothetical protein
MKVWNKAYDGGKKDGKKLIKRERNEERTPAAVRNKD